MLWAAVCILLFPASAKAQSDTTMDLKAAQREIDESNLNYFKAFTKKDTALFSSLYTQDCWIMTPGTSIFCGPKAASEYFAYASKYVGMRDGRFITINVYGISRDLIAEVGFYQLFDAGNVLFDDGKYIVLWRRTGEGWKRFRDAVSSARK